MRVKLTSRNLRALFAAIHEKGVKWDDLASVHRISVRTLSDWRRGTISIPLGVFEGFSRIAGIKKETLSPRILPDFWHLGKAARKGGLTRAKLYGNFGTVDGRRKGGLASLRVHQRSPGRFKVLKHIKKPQGSRKLAEFLGILIGDGHLSEYQVSVTTNSKTDKDHAFFTAKLIKSLFGIKPIIKPKKGENTINVVASSRNMVIFLSRLGMPIGNKIRNGLTIPRWIRKSPTYESAFLRGLFDTDGCIYLDTHIAARKIYKHLGWTITSYAGTLRSDVVEVLKRLGFAPTCRDSQKSVYLRKQSDIHKYFFDIGTNNLKHKDRYKRFIGGVPKWS